MTTTSYKNVRGMREIGNQMIQFPLAMKSKALRSAVRAGAKPVLDEARRNVPVGATGLLQRGLRIRTAFVGDDVVATIVQGGKHAFIGYWLEFTGAAAHMIVTKLSRNGKGGKAKALLLSGDFGGTEGAGVFFSNVEHPGFKPSPYMRKSLDAQANTALIKVGESLRRWLKRNNIKADAVEIDE